jgi:dTDP-glucose pyrophosphorylase
MKTWERVLVEPQSTLREALLKIDAASTQMALVTDRERHLLGTVSDGDIRRGLLKGLSLGDPVAKCMCAVPTTVRAGETREAVLSAMRRAGVHQIPIVDADGVLVGLEIVNDFLIPEARQNWVVIMVGGLGKRLGELTESTPKPMLKVGARPLLETILRSYIDQGFRHFYLAVNYKAELIEAHFGDGAALDAEIRYLREDKALGTAGALSLLPDVPADPFFVANGDLLMKIDYQEMLDKHVEAGAAATMAVREYEFQIPYGVVREENGAIYRIEEKPVCRSLVSAGTYVLSPEALQLVPQNAHYDMPTLFQDLITRGRRTNCCRVHGYWLDIGHMSDYLKANQDFAGLFE